MSRPSFSASANKRLSKSDANSIVGGDSLEDVYDDDAAADAKPPVADPSKPADHQPKASSGTTEVPAKGDYNTAPKVFSFSLPFGGLSAVRSNLYRQFQSFKFDPHLPLLGSSQSSELDQLKQDMNLKLERQQSISTIEDATYFQKFKGTDNARLRAVKHSISANLNDILPGKPHKKSHERIFDEIDGNIVIMGGYRGSILRSRKTGKRVWIPIKAGFNLRKINLLIGPRPEDELKAMDLIYPDGVLKNIGPIDICKKLIKKLSANPKTNVKEYGYDWRLSADIASRQFEEFLEEMYRKTGKPTLVIAHSMGGLIAHGALNRNPKLFRSLVYVGVPSECLNILGPLRYGDSVILNDKILTYETNFMMRSGFIFLPLSGRVFVNTETKEYFDLDYFNPDTWVEYDLNPLVSSKRKLLEEQGHKSPIHLPVSESTGSIPIINSISNKLKHYRSISMNRKTRPSAVDEGSSNSSSQAGSPIRNPLSPKLHPKADSPSVPSFLSSFKTATSEDEVEEHFSFTFTEAYNYLADTLKRAKAYILSLDYIEELETEYPPLAMVYGNKVPSVRGSNVRDRQDIKDGNYYSFFYGHGDGVVHQRWLMPQRKGFDFYDDETGRGQIVGKFASERGHVNLMTDFNAMGKALSAVFEAEKSWKEKKARISGEFVQRARTLDSLMIKPV
ncbi:uncharacterized protein CANTADRAFT_47907 [Suhomyces tanzawaensis NRRL Y-17324]|uniref:Alpha/beta-hydrolase n=1 Tax=Suhomyces tanzawaensis NRRL Y-17324 TaxID=984487 RepID=A0A1E4SMD8_9ASCO|nr:uncharacterized protein CANTADRAFT_47907 [Suhomyces tanzawaensis NRRL Y-17324]ODV80577.1 hypothetical protein CANTADRAFT_47907 [Suhomyces tanzawaensis NRRL Y-17324]